MVAQPRLVTVDEFEQFLALPENADRLFELIDGEIVEKMPTQVHGIVAGNIITWLNMYFLNHPIGLAAVEARHRPSADDQHNDRLPDVSVVLDLTKPVTRQGAAPFLPDICIEIKSPDDTYKEMADTAAFYLANGAKLVWLVYPEQKLVEALTNDTRELIGETGMITAGELLPEFSAPVSGFFRGV